jgi:hypothetical protein
MRTANSRASEKGPAMRRTDSTRSCALAAPQRRLASPSRHTAAALSPSRLRADRGLLERRRRSLRRARRRPGSHPSTKRSRHGAAASSLGCGAAPQRIAPMSTMSSLGYGLGSWGLLNVVFLLSMFYPRRRPAVRRHYEPRRVARQDTFDRDVRRAQAPRTHQRRPRTDCDRPARSAHAPSRRSRTSRRRGIAGVCRSLALHPVSRREPRLRPPGRRPSSCTPVLGPR